MNHCIPGSELCIREAVARLTHEPGRLDPAPAGHAGRSSRVSARECEPDALHSQIRRSNRARCSNRECLQDRRATKGHSQVIFGEPSSDSDDGSVSDDDE
jgi:hypothetical protein